MVSSKCPDWFPVASMRILLNGESTHRTLHFSMPSSSASVSIHSVTSFCCRLWSFAVNSGKMICDFRMKIGKGGRGGGGGAAVAILNSVESSSIIVHGYSTSDSLAGNFCLLIWHFWNAFQVFGMCLYKISHVLGNLSPTCLAFAFLVCMSGLQP